MRSLKILLPVFISFVLLALLLVGCSKAPPQDSATEVITDNGQINNEETGEEPAGDIKLKLLKELEIDEGETRRPLIAVTEDRVYIIYGKLNGATWD